MVCGGVVFLMSGYKGKSGGLQGNKKKVAAIQGLAAIILRGFPGAATECLGGGSGGFPLGYL
jgi:hypothetical protein